MTEGRLPEAKGPISCTGNNKCKDQKTSKRKWHQIILWKTKTCDLIAFSTITV